MAVRINQRLFVWIVLGLCVLAIPVGLLNEKSTPKSTSDPDSSLSDSLIKFKDHIAVLRLSGMIADGEDEFLFPSDESAPAVIKKLRKAIKNDKVKGILLRVNSPGGTVATSQELYSQIVNLKKAGKPVVISMSDLAASGGYYIAAPADKVYALPGTLTGSIGVIMNLMNLKGLGDKVGVKPQVIKSGEFKDLASPFREMTQEERNILQSLIMDSYEQFVKAVADGRKMDVPTVKKIADGRVYSGMQAQKLHLVDELGGYDDALAALQKICMDKYKLKDKLPVRDKSSEGFLGMLLETNFFDGTLRMQAPRIAGYEELLLPASLRSRYLNQPLWVMQ